MSVEETNRGQENNMSVLREAIASRKRLFEVAKETNSVIFAMDFKELPSIIEKTENSEFSLERHAQLCVMIDVVYWNYKVSIEKNEEVEQRLKDLIYWVEEFMTENLKPRFN